MACNGLKKRINRLKSSVRILYSFNFDVSYNFGFVINLLLVRYYVLLSNS